MEVKALFGTDGIRGLANTGSMTPKMLIRVAEGLVCYLKETTGLDTPKIILGKDTRLSGYLLETAFASGICGAGGNIFLTGPIPTPAISYLTKDSEASAGVMISASHNPYMDNGIKIFDHAGEKLNQGAEDWISQWALGRSEIHRPSGPNVGIAKRLVRANQKYLDFLLSATSTDFDLTGKRIVLDCANGAAYRVGPQLYENLGAKVISIATSPNGKNINKNCGALNANYLSQKVLQEGADFGIALDGDADRAILIDEKGTVLTGDHILAMCALDLSEQARLSCNGIIATVMSNLGLELFLKEKGIELVRVGVGDSEVGQAMKKKGYRLGGEQSGHIIFSEHLPTGDGLLTSLKVAELANRKKKPLSELASILKTTPQVLKSIPIKEKRNLDDFHELPKMIQESEQTLGDRGRILVRYSGTEPKVRVMVEGENLAEINQMAKSIVTCIEREIGE